MKKSIMVIENFYDNPDEVRASALQSDLIDYFEDGESYWLTSKHKYLTEENTSKLKQLIKKVGSDIDEEFYKHNKWNGAFQVKYNIYGKMGFDYFPGCLHTHVQNVEDVGNVGSNGWAGVVYLTPDDIAYPHGGTSVWETTTGDKPSFRYTNDVCNDWIPSSLEVGHSNVEGLRLEGMNNNWDLITKIQFKYNTLVLMRAEEYHCGNGSWGNKIDNARIIQTFFIKVK